MLFRSDYRAAVREFYRVLDAGGQLVISVPFSDKYETLVRATVDDEGNIKHLVEPCYNGDPLSSEGVLSFYDFGMELLDEMREAGFQECFLGSPAACQGSSRRKCHSLQVPADGMEIAGPETPAHKPLPVENYQFRDAFHRDDIDADPHHAQ